MEYPDSSVLLGGVTCNTPRIDPLCLNKRVLRENEMPDVRSATLCGLYLDFAPLRDCATEVLSIGVRPVDLALVLPDGSLTSALSILRDSERLGVAIRNRLASPRSGDCVGASRFAPLTGALTKTLLMMGVPAYDSERLESKIRNGGMLLSIRCDESCVAQVRNILVQTSAHEISFSGDIRKFERCSIPRKAPYAPASLSDWQQRSAHA